MLPAYLLTTAGFQLVFGKLYTFLSIKWVFLAAIVIFELGSLICGVAPSSTALIVGRAIAGLGSAGIFSGAYLIIAVSQPLEKRPTFQGLFGAMYGVASIVGPLMGECVTILPTACHFSTVFLALLLKRPISWKIRFTISFQSLLSYPQF